MKCGCMLLLICVCVALTQGDERPTERIVQTLQGPVRGHKQPGDNIFVFYGIPYASVPTGVNKFKAPLPAPAWSSTFDAVDNGIACPQTALPNVTIENLNQKEECLIANVYIPDTEQKNLPVVVYVHGGAYQIGSGGFMELKNLVRSQKIVAVTFNYRLGIHGFLCLGTQNAPGNAGMKDQVALLRWVKKHISSYGGNPNDVTIAGCSAGGGSVSLLMLSPSTKGLFHKVIPESGASIAAWSMQTDPLENAKKFAKTAGFTEVDDVYALEDFYTSASFDLLTSTGGFIDNTDGNSMFSPCVEAINIEEAFLTDNAYNILESGEYSKVPMLFGFTDMEGLVRVPYFDSWKDRMNANFSEFLPLNLQFENEEEREEVIKKIKKYYFDDKPVSPENILSYIDYASDVYFGYPTLKSVELYVKSGIDKLYLYEFNFVDDSVPSIPHTNNIKGSTHCSQTLAVFDGTGWIDKSENNLSEDYKKVKDVTREIWLNFITTGAPVPAGSSLPAWPAAGANGAPHMALGRTLELRGALLEKRVRFWDDIYKRRYRGPQAPPVHSARHTEL